MCKKYKAVWHSLWCRPNKGVKAYKSHETVYDLTCITCNPEADRGDILGLNQFSCRICSFRASWQRAGWGYPGGSSPPPPPLLCPGQWSRPDVIMRQVFKYFLNLCWFQQTWTKIQTIMIRLMLTWCTSKLRQKAGSHTSSILSSTLLQHLKKSFTDSSVWYKIEWEEAERTNCRAAPERCGGFLYVLTQSWH